MNNHRDIKFACKDEQSKESTALESRETWENADPPYTSFLLKARNVIRSVVQGNSIPEALSDAIFYILVFHASDQAMTERSAKGIRISLDFGNWDQETWYNFLCLIRS